MNFFPSACADC